MILLNSVLAQDDSINKFKCIEDFCNEKSYIAAKVLINISPTLYGIKPATLLTFCRRRERDCIGLWDRYKKELVLDKSIKYIELRRTPRNLMVFFYNQAFLHKQVFNKKNLKFLARFGYSENQTLDEMLTHLKSRYLDSCPHEIGIFLGMPLKDVLGYLKLIPLRCSYSGYWKVFGKPEKQKLLFEKFRTTTHRVINLICSGEDPIRILGKPMKYYAVN